MKKRKRMMNNNIPNNNPNNNGKIDDAVKFWMNARKQLDNPYSPEPTGKNITPNQEHTDEDMVNNPSHYRSLESNLNIDCITAMQAAFGKEAVSIFCKLNVFKYTYRSPSKQPVESIKKAQWYLNKYMELAPEFIEEWRLSDDGMYEISNLGNVRRVGNQENRKKVTLKNGYDTVMFSINGKVICKYIHRLVAEAFIPNPNNYLEINHKNHIRTDNRVENLEWCDRKQNVQDAIGTILYVYNTDGDYLGKYNSIRDCEKEFDIGHRSINSYINSDKPKGNLLFYSSFKGECLKLEGEDQ